MRIYDMFIIIILFSIIISLGHHVVVAFRNLPVSDDFSPKGRCVFIDWFCVSFWHWSIGVCSCLAGSYSRSCDGQLLLPFTDSGFLPLMEVILHLFMVYTLMYDPFHTPSAGGDSEGFQKKYEKAEKKTTSTRNHKP